MSPSILISRYLPHHSLINQEDPDPDLTRFSEKGCGCKRAKGKPCSTLFSRAHYEDYRQQCLALTRDELDLVLLGQIMALLLNDTETGPRSSKKPSPRQRSAMLFHHGGWRICGKTFQKLHGIGMIATTIKGVGACEYHNVIIIILISGKRSLYGCESTLPCNRPHNKGT